MTTRKILWDSQDKPLITNRIVALENWKDDSSTITVGRKSWADYVVDDNDCSIAINQALADGALNKKKVILLASSTPYDVANPVILDTGNEFYGESLIHSVIRHKAGVSKHVLITKNFDALKYTGDMITCPNNIAFGNLTIDGNRANLTYSPIPDFFTKGWHKNLKRCVGLYGHNISIQGDLRVNNAGEIAMNSIWAKDTQAGGGGAIKLTLHENQYARIHISDYNIAGYIHEGVNDSYIEMIRCESQATAGNPTKVGGGAIPRAYVHGAILTENTVSGTGNITGSSLYCGHWHTWGSAEYVSTFVGNFNYSSNEEVFAVRCSDMYSEGAPIALYINGQNNNIKANISNCDIGVVIAGNLNTIDILNLHGSITAITKFMLQLGTNQNTYTSVSGASFTIPLFDSNNVDTNKSVSGNRISVAGTINNTADAYIIDIENDGGNNHINALGTWKNTLNNFVFGTINDRSSLYYADIYKTVGVLRNYSNSNFGTPLCNLSRIGDLTGVNIFSFFGDPNNDIVGNKGDICYNKDSNSGALLYIKTTNGGNTGWVAVSNNWDSTTSKNLQLDASEAFNVANLAGTKQLNVSTTTNKVQVLNGGQLEFYSGNYTGLLAYISATTGSALFSADVNVNRAVATSNIALFYKTNNVNRASVSLVNNETGSNAGGELAFAYYNDAGAWQANALEMRRTDGRIRINTFLSLAIANVPTYADNAAAGAGGVEQGRLYKKSDGTLMIKL